MRVTAGNDRLRRVQRRHWSGDQPRHGSLYSMSMKPCGARSTSSAVQWTVWENIAATLGLLLMLSSTMASEGALDPNPSVRTRTRTAMTIGIAITQRPPQDHPRNARSVPSSVTQSCAEGDCRVRQRPAVRGPPSLEATKSTLTVARSEILRHPSSSCAQSGHESTWDVSGALRELSCAMVISASSSRCCVRVMTFPLVPISASMPFWRRGDDSSLSRFAHPARRRSRGG